MARKASRNTFVIGGILIVGGLAALAVGYYQFDAARASLGNAIGKVFTGKSGDESRAWASPGARGAAARVGAFPACIRRSR